MTLKVCDILHESLLYIHVPVNDRHNVKLGLMKLLSKTAVTRQCNLL